MPHLKRFLWLFAWSVWLAIGVGLHQQLPRRPGPPIATLPLEPHHAVLGFVKTISYVVVQSALPVNARIMPFNERTASLRVFDARTGRQVRETAPGSYNAEHRPEALRTHGVLFVHGKPPALIGEGPSAALEGLYAYDVAADHWVKLADGRATMTTVHPTKPWVAFTDFNIGRPALRVPRRPPRRPAVVDFTTGAELLARPSSPSRGGTSHAFFLGDTARMIVPVWLSQPKPGVPHPAELEIWKIGPTSSLEKVVVLPDFSSSNEASNNGRVAWTINSPKVVGLDVYDLLSERMLFSEPPSSDRQLPPLGFGPRERLSLSKNGRTVLGGYPVKLWDVDAGALLWAPDATQHATPDADGETFWVAERWAELWGGPKDSRWNTVARRDLESARLMFRCWDRDKSILLLTNADDTLGISSAGAVHRLPFTVDWLLLAVCQTILALPLVLLWAMLRWRRKRRLRLASVAP